MLYYILYANEDTTAMHIIWLLGVTVQHLADARCSTITPQNSVHQVPVPQVPVPQVPVPTGTSTRKHQHHMY